MPARFRSAVDVYALVAAVAAVLLSPLLGVAYFATVNGAEYLEVATVAAWAEPARDAAGGLLTFASADRVYVTYVQLLALCVPALALAAARARAWSRAAGAPAMAWRWRTAIAGHALLAAGVVGAALVGVVSVDSPAFTAAFLAGVVPGILLSTVGGSVLGISLLRSRFRPGATAWLLAGAFPLWICGSFLLGHNSLGLLPLFAAWAIAAEARLRAAPAVPPAAATA